jgi:hypothetical protein
VSIVHALTMLHVLTLMVHSNVDVPMVSS